MAQKLTEKTAKQLVESVDRLCDFVDQGDSPTQAAIKVASEAGLTPAKIALVCRSYNSGAVDSARRGSESFAEKFAAVPKADPSEVVRELYPTKVKLSADADVVSPVYLPQPATTAKAAAERTAPVVDMHKAARCECGCDAFRGHCREQHLTSYEKASRLHKELVVRREQTNRLESEAVTKVAAVVDAFARTYPNRWELLPALRKHAAEFYGETGAILIDRVAAKRMPQHKLSAYLADPRLTLGRLPRDRNNPVLVAVKEAKEALEKLARARAALPAAAISIRREIAEVDPRYRKDKTAAILPPGMSEKQVRDARWRKRSSILAGAVGSMATKLRGGSEPPKDSNDLLSARLQLNDPSHDAELKRVQAEAMLNALANSDEVIGSYSPEEVADAFEEVGQSAPNLVTNMSLLRANMRKQLAGNLTPYEADAMVQSGLKSQPRETVPREKSPE